MLFRSKDIASGAVSGGVLGAAFGAGAPLVSKGASAAKEAAKKAIGSTLLGEEVIAAKELGEAGKGFITKESRIARNVEKATKVDDIKSDLLKIADNAAEEFKIPLKTADELGSVVQPQFDLDPEEGFKLANFFEEQGETRIAKGLNQLADEGLTPSAAYALRKQIKEAANSNPKLLSPAKDLVSTIDDEIENVIQSDEVQDALEKDLLPTSYKEGLKTYSNVLKSTIESITEKGKPVDARRKFFHDLAASDATLFEKIQELVNKLSLPGTTSEEAIRTIYSKEGGIAPLLDQLIKTEAPDAMTKIGRAHV